MRYLHLLMTIVAIVNGFAGEVGLRGQVDGSVLLGTPQIRTIQLRYIPSADAHFPSLGSIQTDLELAANLYARSDRQTSGIESDAELYRGWLRLSTTQFELRLGLQKINFGPALLLRGLRWFDRLDPRDPLQITEGINAALMRYYWLNNANLWLWSIWPDDEAKGLEFLPTREDQPEFGGRIQYPFFSGELAFSGHYRQAAFPELLQLITNREAFDEQKFALDGKWDPLMGLWFEAVMVRRDLQLPANPILFKNTWFLTLGTDYTFPISNGLRVTLEQMLIRNSDGQVISSQSADLTALYMNLPMGLLDALTAVAYVDWQNQRFSQFIGWNRTYDSWSFNANVFWSSENAAVSVINSSAFAANSIERGIQIQAVFNH